jgi:hypothetical protein
MSAMLSQRSPKAVNSIQERDTGQKKKRGQTKNPAGMLTASSSSSSPPG